MLKIQLLLDVMQPHSTTSQWHESSTTLLWGTHSQRSEIFSTSKINWLSL